MVQGPQKQLREGMKLQGQLSSGLGVWVDPSSDRNKDVSTDISWDK